MPPQHSAIDFSSQEPSDFFVQTDALHYPAVHVVRGVLEPNPGMVLSSPHMLAVVHEGPPVEMLWQAPNERMRRARIKAGDVHISPADRRFFLRWPGRSGFLVTAFEHALVAAVSADLGIPAERVRTVIGGRDMEIEAAARRWRRELREGGGSGALFAESLATLVAVHLFRTYGVDVPQIAPRGGLGAGRFQRVIDYIEANLGEEIHLDDLAGIAGLSTTRFGQAFRISAGVAPHRFIMERRIERAKELLVRSDMPITAIAMLLGFSSHGHFTMKFRKLTGVTPTQFRNEAR